MSRLGCHWGVGLLLGVIAAAPLCGQVVAVSPGDAARRVEFLTAPIGASLRLRPILRMEQVKPKDPDSGATRILVVAGMRAEDLAGSRSAEKWVKTLEGYPSAAEWFVVPRVNPDGLARAETWLEDPARSGSPGWLLPWPGSGNAVGAPIDEDAILQATPEAQALLSATRIHQPHLIVVLGTGDQLRGSLQEFGREEWSTTLKKTWQYGDLASGLLAPNLDPAPYRWESLWTLGGASVVRAIVPRHFTIEQQGALHDHQLAWIRTAVELVRPEHHWGARKSKLSTDAARMALVLNPGAASSRSIQGWLGRQGSTVRTVAKDCDVQFVGASRPNLEVTRLTADQPMVPWSPGGGEWALASRARASDPNSESSRFELGAIAGAALLGVEASLVRLPDSVATSGTWSRELVPEWTSNKLAVVGARSHDLGSTVARGRLRALTAHRLDADIVVNGQEFRAGSVIWKGGPPISELILGRDPDLVIDPATEPGAATLLLGAHQSPLRPPAVAIVLDARSGGLPSAGLRLPLAEMGATPQILTDFAPLRGDHVPLIESPDTLVARDDREELLTWIAAGGTAVFLGEHHQLIKKFDWPVREVGPEVKATSDPSIWKTVRKVASDPALTSEGPHIYAQRPDPSPPIRIAGTVLWEEEQTRTPLLMVRPHARGRMYAISPALLEFPVAHAVTSFFWAVTLLP